MSAAAHVPVCTYIESAPWCVWSMGEAQDKLSGHRAVLPVLLCFLLPLDRALLSHLQTLGIQRGIGLSLT